MNYGVRSKLNKFTNHLKGNSRTIILTKKGNKLYTRDGKVYNGELDNSNLIIDDIPQDYEYTPPHLANLTERSD